MNAAIAGVVQVIGGIVLAPLMPGMIQFIKARLQGRRGASPLQPYRDLRRLWRKSSVTPEGTTVVYQLAPAVTASAMLVMLLFLPIAGVSPKWPVGNDALVLVGMFAVTRFAMAVASWDNGSGFALMGAARDLTIAVFAEALFLVLLVLAALPASSTDLVAMNNAAAGSVIWQEPGHWFAAFGFALVILVETGRLPIDNPDTHLELTMIHEGPLLEYAGRDLALLQWSSSVRHWAMLVLAAGLFLPQWGGFGVRLGLMSISILILCLALALTETFQAKLRILQVPALLMTVTALALLGLVSWSAGWAT